MKLFYRYLKDRLLFTLIYAVPVALIIMFYVLIKGSDEIMYPVLIAVFFYAVYMLIGYVKYYIHNSNIEKLKKTSADVHSSSYENKAEYEALLRLHSFYSTEIASNKKQAIEDTRFISAFIHNLKTPVTVIDIMLQRAANGELSDREALEGIAEEKDRLTSNLNMLLDLQRIKELQNDYQPGGVNLDEELQKIINNNKRLFINSKVYPKFTYSEHYVYTDSKWNEVLINQIISNGVKYSSGDEQKYMYFTIEQDEKHTSLIIQDEGMGIPEYDLVKIFEPFYTGTNGRTGKSSSGIGLYLCKQICEKLGHRITIDNNNGCRVTITYLSKL